MKEKIILVLGPNLAMAKSFIHNHVGIKDKAKPISTFQHIVGARAEGYVVYLIHGHNWNKEFGRIFDYIRIHGIEFYRIDE